MIDLTIVNSSGLRVPQAHLRQWVEQVEKQITKRTKHKLHQRELVIAFVTKKEIQRLNKEFRGKNKPTDVLSFESDSLGELAISPEVIAEQAREHGLAIKHELGYMVLHGILHLLGYDHETGERGAKKMFTLQDAIFDELLKKSASKKSK